MKAYFIVGFLLAALPAQAKLKIVATVGDLGAIAREVGGQEAEVIVLAKPTQDPHYVDAKPSLVLDLSRANLLLFMGLDLEIGWLPVLLTSSRNGSVQPGAPGYLDCSTLIEPKEVPLQKLDRSMGDIHPGGNPHYTTDPRNGIRIARAVAERMAELDSDHAEMFLRNAEKFEQAMTARIAAWDKRLAPYRGTPMVTYHKSWIYFAEWSGLEMVAFIEPKPGIPPNPAHVTNVLRIITTRKVPLILQEDWYSSQTSELLARNSGAKLARVQGVSGEKESYADHLDKIVSAVVNALGSTRR